MTGIINLNRDWKQVRPTLQLATEIEVGGYQVYTVDRTLEDPRCLKPREPKLRQKDRLIRPWLVENAEGRSVLDLGAAGGYFGLLAHLCGSLEPDFVEVDHDYAVMLRSLFASLNIDAAVIERNVVEVWTRADVVFALGLIHWIYACSANLGSLDTVVGFLRQRTLRTAFIEWISPKDPAIEWFGHLTKYAEASGPYTFEVFKVALGDHFSAYHCVGSTNSTRKVFRCDV